MKRIKRAAVVLMVVACFNWIAGGRTLADTATVTLQQGINGYEGGSDDNLRGGSMKLVDDVKKELSGWHENQIMQGKAKREEILASLADYRHVMRWDDLDKRTIGKNVKVISAKAEVFYTDEFWSFYDYHLVLYRSLDGTKDNTAKEPAGEAHIMGERRGKEATPFRSWVTFDLRPEVLQAWIDDPKANQGLVLAMPEKTDPPGQKSTGGFVKFASNACGMAELRPKLTIVYEFTGNVEPFAPKLTQRWDGVCVGREFALRWSLPEKPDLNGDPVSVEIQYASKGGEWTEVARNVPADGGEYLWKTDAAPAGGGHRVRIRAVDPSGAVSPWTESDGLFEVVRHDVPFQIGIEPPLTKLRRDHAYLGRLGNRAAIELAGNEYEGFQIVIAGVHRDVEGVRVVPGDLKGPGGATIPAARIAVNPVGYVNTAPTNKYSASWVGLWPDVLLGVDAVDIPAGKVQPFWVTVYAPAGTLAGTYSGTLKIEGKGIAAQTVELSARVFGFDLPVRSTFRSMAIAGGPDRKFYELEEGPELDNLREMWFEFLCAHRLPPGGYVLKAWSWDKPVWPVKTNADGSWDFSVAEKWGKFCFDRGMNTFVAAGFTKPGKWGFPEKYSEKYYADYTKFMTAYVAFLKKNGWLENAVAYNIDEAPDKHWEMCKENFRRTKAISPELSVFQCLNAPKGVAALEGFFDVVDVNIGQYHQGAAPRLLREGKRVWWCICCWPSSHPNLFVEYPAMDARIVGWLSWKLGVEGFEYWAVASWARCMKDMGAKKFVDEVESKWAANSFGDYNGDGYLCYPGPNNTLLSSIRFEALRDGFEDYEYFALLKRRLEGKTGPDAEVARRLLEIPDAVCRSDLEFTKDATGLFETRRKVAAAIEQLGE